MLEVLIAPNRNKKKYSNTFLVEKNHLLKNYGLTSIKNFQMLGPALKGNRLVL